MISFSIPFVYYLRMFIYCFSLGLDNNYRFQTIPSGKFVYKRTLSASALQAQIYRQSPIFSLVTKNILKPTSCKYWSFLSFLDTPSPFSQQLPPNLIEIRCENIQQVFLLYHWGSLVTLEVISLKPLVRSLEKNPLAVKLLDNWLYI